MRGGVSDIIIIIKRVNINAMYLVHDFCGRSSQEPTEVRYEKNDKL